MKTFVMGDIHGAYKALLQCLDRAGFDKKCDRLIQLGDVADGYDDVYRCVEELLSIPNLVSIRGNHDEWVRQFIETGIHPIGWEERASATARSYLKLHNRENEVFLLKMKYVPAIFPRDIPESHRHFFQKQQLYFIDESNNCYVHAGFDRHRDIEGQKENIYYWDRKLWTAALSFQKFHDHQAASGPFKMVTPFNKIFTGHSCTLLWHTDQPMKAANIYNLDTGAGHEGRLTIMDVATKEYWQSDRIYSA